MMTFSTPEKFLEYLNGRSLTTEETLTVLGWLGSENVEASRHVCHITPSPDAKEVLRLLGALLQTNQVAVRVFVLERVQKHLWSRDEEVVCAALHALRDGLQPRDGNSYLVRVDVIAADIKSYPHASVIAKDLLLKLGGKLQKEMPPLVEFSPDCVCASGVVVNVHHEYWHLFGDKIYRCYDREELVQYVRRERGLDSKLSSFDISSAVYSEDNIDAGSLSKSVVDNQSTGFFIVYAEDGVAIYLVENEVRVEDLEG